MMIEMPVHGNGMLWFLRAICCINLEEYWALEKCRLKGFPAVKQTASQKRTLEALEKRGRVKYSELTGKWELTELGAYTLQIVNTYLWLTEPKETNHRAQLILFPSLDIEERKRETVNT